MIQAGDLRVGIISHPEKSEAKELARKVEEWLRARNVRCEQFSAHHAEEKPPFNLVLVLSGDGYLMHIARSLAPHKIPVLGINAGHMGFLTLAEQDTWQDALLRVLRNDYVIEKRVMLSVRFEKRLHLVANEVYIRHTDGIVILDVEVNGALLYKNLMCDGVIVSSPLGSTAYNMSAGGPIVRSSARVLVFTPIAPIDQNVKPLVLGFRDIVRVTQRDKREENPSDSVRIKIDGRSIGTMEKGGFIVVRANKRIFSYFVDLGVHTFVRALHEKVGVSR